MFNRKRVYLGRVPSTSEKKAVEAWYKAGNSRNEMVFAELHLVAPETAMIEVFDTKKR